MVKVDPNAGSIPASAGNPARSIYRDGRPRVHPRERGESFSDAGKDANDAGPSPRARGIRPHRSSRSAAHGSIPASAGNPGAGLSWPHGDRVHPRERGESPLMQSGHHLSPGPSPRARGILCRPAHPIDMLRSIPASAGNPRPSASRPPASWVHPRERGESRVVVQTQDRITGPSPRARGILSRCRATSRACGSIPASAGNPPPVSARPIRAEVHPRERGESRPLGRYRRGPTGPSPRARGIQSHPLTTTLVPRSIPASAGNPRCRPEGASCAWVHPRERGESLDAERPRPQAQGPSPRARGIREKAAWTAARRGSIPASAGNPVAKGCIAHVHEVHPRERGESPDHPHLSTPLLGPSPRARGIPAGGGR